MNWLLLEKNDSKSLFKQFYFFVIFGEMAEWFKAHAWKACLGETLSWVRIPLSPPFFLIFNNSKTTLE